jgi:hypothetical protein
MPGKLTPQQLEGAARLLEQVIPVLFCPSRRVPTAYPVVSRTAFPAPNFVFPDVTGRVDYAASSADMSSFEPPPSNLSAARTWPWCYDRKGTLLNEHQCGGSSTLTGANELSGVIFRRSEIRIQDVTDGASNTYLIGEKAMRHVPEDDRWTGDHVWCVGDIGVYSTRGIPVRDSDRLHFSNDFGSAHRWGFHMSYCDGSVRVVEYDIAPQVHLAGMNRHDGMVFGN